MRINDVDQKQSIVMNIVLQTQILKECPVHHQVFCDEEADPAIAFALAVQLIHHNRPLAMAFQQSVHVLADMLSETIAAAPNVCPQCPGSLAAA
jgi:uncharacterized membrane protein